MNILATEEQDCWLPGIQINELPNSLPSSIRLLVRGNEVGIRASGVVGALPLLNGSTLQILPKIGIANFFRLLIKSEGGQSALDREFHEFVSYSTEAGESLSTLVCRSLFRSLDAILANGPSFDRLQVTRRGDYAVGSLLPVETALSLAIKTSDPIHYRTKERSLDTPENRVLSAAMHRAWSMLSLSDRSEFTRIRSKWHNRMPSAGNNPVDLQVVEERFCGGKYDGARDYYRRPIMLAKVILGLDGVALGEEASVSGDATLINTADVYEKYLRNLIRELLTSNGYVVSKPTHDAISLYTDGSYALEPDVLISRGGTAKLIVDAKYKTPSAADHYQMQAYLNAYGLKNGVLGAPSSDGSEPRSYERMTPHGLIVHELEISLEDLEATEAYLHQSLHHLLRP